MAGTIKTDYKLPRNPVATKDSIDALDLLDQSFKLLRDSDPADAAFLDRMREQRLRHFRALRKVIGKEPLGGNE